MTMTTTTKKCALNTRDGALCRHTLSEDGQCPVHGWNAGRTDTATEIVPPVKGTVWLHARRTEHNGDPRQLTVTSVTRGVVYSRDSLGLKVKTRVEIFPAMCLRVVSVPAPAAKPASPTLSGFECVRLYVAAHQAGMAAGEAVTPAAMEVLQRKNPFDDASPVVRAYDVPEGVCGFAYVTVRPGNGSFARHLKECHGGFKAYYGGTQMSVRPFGQSYERKVAYALAFVGVLREAGINASVDSRMD